MPTLVFADGDPELRTYFRRLLAANGFQVETAADGPECLSQLRRFAPELLVLEWELPLGGGDGVLAVLREDPHLLPSRIVLTSALTTACDVTNSEWLSLIKIMSKPFRVSELLDHLRTGNSVEREQTPRGTNAPGILVVDDEPAVRALLQAHLGQQGYRVWATSTGEEALDLCWSHGSQISVALLDIQMPGLDGPQTLDRIQHVRAGIPVCFMTGDPGSYAPSDLPARGARFIFRKPLCLDEILYVLQHLTEDSAVMSY